MATYRLHYFAFRKELLNAPWMVAYMRGVAERAAGIAEATAPFDPDDPDGQHYRERFSVTAGTHGGIHHDRAYGRLANDDVHIDGDGAEFNVAVAVEFGNALTPAHHTVWNAMNAAADT